MVLDTFLDKRLKERERRGGEREGEGGREIGLDWVFTSLSSIPMFRIYDVQHKNHHI